MLLEIWGLANNYIKVAYWKDCSDDDVKNASELTGHFGRKQWIEGLDILSVRNWQNIHARMDVILVENAEGTETRDETVK